MFSKYINYIKNKVANFKKLDKNKRKSIILMIIVIITLFTFVIGATYAYFAIQSNKGNKIDTNIISGGVDNLSFYFGDEIYIVATEENFGKGMGNISDSTTASAMLRANDATNKARATYNIYLIIENNNFEYTTDEQIPEIVLNVTDPNGKRVENITGLVHYENGFDITTRTGGFLLVADYVIEVDNVRETIQSWDIEVTFINLDSDQQKNTEKTLTAKLYLTQEQMNSYELTEINSITTVSTYESVTATLNLTNGSAGVSKYYYGIEEVSDATSYVGNNKVKRLSQSLASNEDIEYIESDNNTYVFNNLKENSSYNIYSYVVDNNKVKSNIYKTTVRTDEYVYSKINNLDYEVTLNSISLTVDASNGSNEIAKYMYSKDNGLSWEESESNTYTFSNLTDSTKYDIKVKVVDSVGKESVEYYEAITTEVYILPVVTTVDVDTTYNSITLVPTGEDGTFEISKYLYSINDGDYQESNVFNNLEENTEYKISVKAVDSYGRESNIYDMNVTTDTYVLPVITGVTVSSSSDSITLRITASDGDGSVSSYHYSRDDGSNYEVSNNSSYTFTGLTSNTTYYIKVYVTDSNGRVSGEYSTNVTTKFPSLAQHVMNLYVEDGVNDIYLHDGQGAYGTLEAGDNSYRYAGGDYEIADAYKGTYDEIFGELVLQDGMSGSFYLSYEMENNYYSVLYQTLDLAAEQAYKDGYLVKNSINNFVCIGSDADVCPNDNLYRIIGVFDGRIKLIKYDYATLTQLGTGTMYENYVSTSGQTWYKGHLSNIYRYSNASWRYSDLKETHLNTNYINYLNKIDPKWVEMIEAMSWKVGENTLNSRKPKDAYTYEITNVTTTSTDKIGLMYVSDYAYAASPIHWNKVLYNSSYMLATSNDYKRATVNNWMYMGYWDWTISGTSSKLYAIELNGEIDSNNADTGMGVRPTFYLRKEIGLNGGTGEMDDPFRISIPPKIEEVLVTRKDDSITLDVTAVAGDSAISGYYYSINDGETYVESTNNSYTFSNLNASSSYKIKIYVKNNNGGISTVYSTTITTEAPLLATVCNVGDNLAGCIKEYYETYGEGVNDIYLHDGVGAYGSLEAGDNSYRYAGGDYEIADAYKGTYDEIFGELVLQDGMSGSFYLSYEMENNYYSVLYQSLDLAAEQAYKDGYLVKNSINNFVCIGSDAEVCPNDNLYRIIGVFDGRIKLIKYDFATSTQLGTGTMYDSAVSMSGQTRYKGQLTTLYEYNWYNGRGDNWRYSDLKETHLNTNFVNYLNRIDPKWVEMIEEMSWKVGENTLNSRKPKDAYTYEITNVTTTSTDKIGLMYVSDYAYAASPNHWDRVLYNSYYMLATSNDYKRATVNNWMHMGWGDWTISGASGRVYTVDANGSISAQYADTGMGVRPTFYLNANVAYQEGDGSIDSPFRIYLPS